MSIKYIALTILCCSIIISCSKEEVTTEIEECEFNYADNIEILESSEASLVFYGAENNAIFTDGSGTNHEFSFKKEEHTIWCLHIWVCDIDTSQKETFWAKRPIKKLEYSSNSTNYGFNFSSYASLNHKEPTKYSDILNIGVVASEHNCDVSTYILNPRNDDSASNNDLILSDSMLINNQMYYDVISDRNEEFEINYNLEKGLLSLIDLNNEMEFEISE